MCFNASLAKNVVNVHSRPKMRQMTIPMPRYIHHIFGVEFLCTSFCTEKLSASISVRFSVVIILPFERYRDYNFLFKTSENIYGHHYFTIEYTEDPSPKWSAVKF